MKEYISHPIHGWTYKNYHEVRASKRVGCIYCKAIIPATEVTKWTDQTVTPRNATAKCPLCSIDAILPDARIEVTPELLRQMHRVWFS